MLLDIQICVLRGNPKAFNFSSIRFSSFHSFLGINMFVCIVAFISWTNIFISSVETFLFETSMKQKKDINNCCKRYFNKKKSIIVKTLMFHISILFQIYTFYFTISSYYILQYKIYHNTIENLVFLSCFSLLHLFLIFLLY